jgi:Fe-S cluster assembly iron-binding protein IscA
MISLSIENDAVSQLREELGGRVLRIAFTTGCGGSGYRLSMAEQPGDDDVVTEVDSIRIALDDMSARRLDGAVIRYDANEGYTLDHPDAASAVWCG